MSKTYIAAVVALLSGALPLFGFEIADSVAFTNFIFNVVTVIAAIIVFARRAKVGDISALGIRKK